MKRASEVMRVRRMSAVLVLCAILVGVLLPARTYAARKTFLSVDGTLCNARIEWQGDTPYVQVAPFAACLGAEYSHDYSQGMMSLSWSGYTVFAWPPADSSSARVAELVSPGPGLTWDTYDMGPHHAYESNGRGGPNMLPIEFLASALEIRMWYDVTNSTIRVYTDDTPLPDHSWLADYGNDGDGYPTLPHMLRANRCLTNYGTPIVEAFEENGFTAFVDRAALRVRVLDHGSPVADWYCTGREWYTVWWGTVDGTQTLADALDSGMQDESLGSLVGGGGLAYGASLIGGTAATALGGVGLVAAVGIGFDLRNKWQYAKDLNDCADLGRNYAWDAGLNSDERKLWTVGTITSQMSQRIGCAPRYTWLAVSLKGAH